MNEYLTTAQVAERLGLSRRQVQTLIKGGALPATKFGRDHQIRPEDVEALLPRPKPGWPKGRKRTT